MTAAIALAILHVIGPHRSATPGMATTARIWAAQVVLVSEAAKIDPFLVVALGERESGWRPGAVGKVGERGILQINPTGGAWAKFGPLGASWDAAFKVPVNLRVGVAWLAAKRRHCGTADPVLWISSYRGGLCRATAYSRGIVARAGVLRGMAADVVVDRGEGRRP